MWRGSSAKVSPRRPSDRKVVRFQLGCWSQRDNRVATAQQDSRSLLIPAVPGRTILMPPRLTRGRCHDASHSASRGLQDGGARGRPRERTKGRDGLLVRRARKPRLQCGARMPRLQTTAYPERLGLRAPLPSPAHIPSAPARRRSAIILDHGRGRPVPAIPHRPTRLFARFGRLAHPARRRGLRHGQRGRQ
jgi:hypothetical protein